MSRPDLLRIAAEGLKMRSPAIVLADMIASRDELTTTVGDIQDAVDEARGVTYFKASLADSIKETWIARELPNWTAEGSPKREHVIHVLRESPDGKLVCVNRIEAEVLMRSAEAQTATDQSTEEGRKLARACTRIMKSLKLALSHDH